MESQAYERHLEFARSLAEDEAPSLRLKPSEAQWLYDESQGRGNVLTDSHPRQRVPKESEARAVRRLARRFLTAPQPFPKTGRPSFPYESLVIDYIVAIESATGHPFRLSRSGPEMKLLLAALNRALFASGPPSIEALKKIACRHVAPLRKPKRTT
jgi:hypothetical protein